MHICFKNVQKNSIQEVQTNTIKNIRVCVQHATQDVPKSTSVPETTIFSLQKFLISYISYLIIYLRFKILYTFLAMVYEAILLHNAFFFNRVKKLLFILSHDFLKELKRLDGKI